MSLENYDLLHEAEKVAVLTALRQKIAEEGARELTLEERIGGIEKSLRMIQVLMPDERGEAAREVSNVLAIKNRIGRLPKWLKGPYRAYARISFVLAQQEILGRYLLYEYDRLATHYDIILSSAVSWLHVKHQATNIPVGYAVLCQVLYERMNALREHWRLMYPNAAFSRPQISSLLTESQ